MSERNEMERYHEGLRQNEEMKAIRAQNRTTISPPVEAPAPTQPTPGTLDDGFVMYKNIGKPAQPASSPTREHGWLIERYCGDHTGKLMYLRLLSYSNESAKPVWVDDSNTALRLARQEDAVEVAKLFPQMCCLAKVTEHIWIGVEDVTTR